jgi:hypothetical protein
MKPEYYEGLFCSRWSLGCFLDEWLRRRDRKEWCVHKHSWTRKVMTRRNRCLSRREMLWPSNLTLESKWMGQNDEDHHEMKEINEGICLGISRLWRFILEIYWCLLPDSRVWILSFSGCILWFISFLVTEISLLQKEAFFLIQGYERHCCTFVVFLVVTQRATMMCIHEWSLHQSLEEKGVILKWHHFQKLSLSNYVFGETSSVKHDSVILDWSSFSLFSIEVHT